MSYLSQMLDDFVDVTKYEKQVMHLWNSFVRKQRYFVFIMIYAFNFIFFMKCDVFHWLCNCRVLADGHIPWACEAFSKLHAQDLVQEVALLW